MQGLKEYSNWPTYPQLYVNGELLGGCDIIQSMDEDGSLKEAIEEMLQASSKDEKETIEKVRHCRIRRMNSHNYSREEVL